MKLGMESTNWPHVSQIGNGVLKLGMESPKWAHSPQAQNGVPSHTVEVVWDKWCWSQGPFLSLPRLDPVTGGDSELAAVTSYPHHPILPWHGTAPQTSHGH